MGVALALFAVVFSLEVWRRDRLTIWPDARVPLQFEGSVGDGFYNSLEIGLTNADEESPGAVMGLG